jgi:hypothetical protein
MAAIQMLSHVLTPPLPRAQELDGSASAAASPTRIPTARSVTRIPEHT